MKFSRFISTIFLATTFACIYLFAGIFWFYASAGPECNTLSLIKDSFSTTAGFFGGIATLVAAYIASRLFNDWKVQHNKTVIGADARKAFKLLHDERNFLNDLKWHLDKISDNNESVFFTVNDEDIQKIVKQLVGLHNDNRFHLAEFVYLIESQDTYKIISEYRKSINNMVTNIDDWKKTVKNYKHVKSTYESNLKDSLSINAQVLDSLTGFVLYKDITLK